jgi:signal transduction histidine kinase/CheY-like chemotaxis protein
MTSPAAHNAATTASDVLPVTRRDILVAEENIRTHYRGMPAAFIGIAFVATIVSLALPPVQPDYVMPLWLSGIYVLSITRFLLWRGYQRIQPQGTDVHRWGTYAALVYGASGTLWGLGNILFYTPGQIEYQLLLLFVSLGAAMGAVVGQISHMPTFYAFTYPLLVLSIGSFLREPDAIHVAFSALMLVYLGVGNRLALSLHRSYSESVNLRFENVDLIEDLQRQKAAAEHAQHVAEEASVSKSRFLAAASHDLRQPLHALSLFVRALEESVLPDPERDTLGKVRRAVDAMEELFNALLDVSRLDAGVVSVNPATVALAPIVERVVSQHQALAKDKGLRLRARCPVAYVCTDPVLLERILRNLVDNALRHTQRGGVLVGCRRRGDALRLEVWDTGPGIPEDQRQAVFREFVQLGNPERDRRKGLGLGLAIVERLGRLLQHPIEMHSTPGRGSVFAVLLPGRPEQEAQVVSTDPYAGFLRSDLTGAFVVVVDDEIAVQEGMQTLLTKWGCETLCAGCLDEALAKLARAIRAPDVIISDYRLRNAQNGIQIIERLRAEFNADIPAMLVSGDTGPERLREAEVSGLPILHKPLHPARLRSLLAGMLHHKAAAADQ